MPRRTSTRIALAFAIVGLAVLLATGAGLFVVLRGLHQEATQAALGDVAQPLVARLPPGTTAAEIRRALRVLREELPEAVGVAVILPGGRTLTDGSGMPDIASLALDPALGRGETVSGVMEGPDRTRYLYAATVVRRAPGAANPTALVLTTRDRSGAQALGDLARVIPFVVLMVVVICGPIAWLLSRSLTRPLARLAAATANLPASGAPPLPLEGPEEVRELTATFNRMAAALDARRVEEGELLASVRHDLRTPVTVIGGFAEALLDGTATGPASERAARAIAEEAARLERLIDALATLDEVGAGRANLRPEPVEAGEVVRSTVARFHRGEADATTPGPTVVAEPVDPGLIVAADRLAVDRILGNLVANALAAHTSGSRPDATVVVGAVPASLPGGRSAVGLRVSDNGPGFPPGSLDRVFDRFYRGDPSRAGAGTGLGLAIVRALARAHGGEAIAENLAPTGARVTVLLPAVGPATPADTDHSTNRPAVESTAPVP